MLTEKQKLAEAQREATQKYTSKMMQLGFKRLTLWIPKDKVNYIKKKAEYLRERALK